MSGWVWVKVHPAFRRSGGTPNQSILEASWYQNGQIVQFSWSLLGPKMDLKSPKAGLSTIKKQFVFIGF